MGNWIAWGLVSTVFRTGSLRAQDFLMHSRIWRVGFAKCRAAYGDKAWKTLVYRLIVTWRWMKTTRLRYQQSRVSNVDFHRFAFHLLRSSGWWWVGWCLCNSKTTIVWKRFPFVHRHFYFKHENNADRIRNTLPVFRWYSQVIWVTISFVAVTI